MEKINWQQLPPSGEDDNEEILILYKGSRYVARLREAEGKLYFVATNPLNKDVYLPFGDVTSWARLPEETPTP